MPIPEFIRAGRDIFQRKFAHIVCHGEIGMRHVGNPCRHPTVDIAFHLDRPFRFLDTGERHLLPVLRLLFVHRLVDAAKDMHVVINLIAIQHRQARADRDNLDVRRKFTPQLVDLGFRLLIQCFALGNVYQVDNRIFYSVVIPNDERFLVLFGCTADCHVLSDFEFFHFRHVAFKRHGAADGAAVAHRHRFVGFGELKHLHLTCRRIGGEGWNDITTRQKKREACQHVGFHFLSSL